MLVNADDGITALMIHGGGHVMLSRKDVRPRQIKLLLEHGLLPVSIDYRLCPELNLIQGVCDALRWARDELPKLRLKHSGVEVDGSQVVAIGWSSGGHLAMTLAWTTPLRTMRPPEAILAFYCPLDYEDKCECRRFQYQHQETINFAANISYNRLEVAKLSWELCLLLFS